MIATTKERPDVSKSDRQSRWSDALTLILGIIVFVTAGFAASRGNFFVAAVLVLGIAIICARRYRGRSSRF